MVTTSTPQPPVLSSPAAATYRGTGGTLLRTRGWTVLLGVHPGHPLVAACWDRMLADPGDPVDLLEGAALPAALAWAVLDETDGRRVVTRGGVTVDDAVGVTLTLVGDRTRGPALPLTDGVVAASAVNVVPRGDEGSDLGTDRTADEAGRTTVAVHGPSRRARSAEETLPTVLTGRGTLTGRVRSGRDELDPDGEEPDGEADVRQPVATPRVLAARCPVGHLTAAYSDVCRVCRRAVAAQELFETARPVLGRLVLPDGRLVPLDRAAVLGRAPSVPQDWTGAPPRLVAVDDPEHDVSAQHLALVPDLWHVLVRDLGSTNGSGLLDQDGRTTPLRPHQPVLLRPGGAVVLADVVTVRFEALP